MKKWSAAWSLLVLVSAGGIGWKVNSSADDHVRPIPDTVSAAVPEIAAPLMMQTKLTTSQRVLEGLLNRDFAKIQTSAQALGQIAELASPSRQGLEEDRIHEHFRTEFIRLCGQLEFMAAEENLEGAAYIHQNLTAACISCHTHVRDAASR